MPKKNKWIEGLKETISFLFINIAFPTLVLCLLLSLALNMFDVTRQVVILIGAVVGTSLIWWGITHLANRKNHKLFLYHVNGIREEKDFDEHKKAFLSDNVLALDKGRKKLIILTVNSKHMINLSDIESMEVRLNNRLIKEFADGSEVNHRQELTLGSVKRATLQINVKGYKENSKLSHIISFTANDGSSIPRAKVTNWAYSALFEWYRDLKEELEDTRKENKMKEAFHK